MTSDATSRHRCTVSESDGMMFGILIVMELTQCCAPGQMGATGTSKTVVRAAEGSLSSLQRSITLVCSVAAP